MWSRIDYIFVESLDKCVMITIYILMLFQDIKWINDETYHPCPRWIVLSSTTLLPSHQHKLVHVWCYTLSSLLSSNCSSLPWSITILYVKNVLRIVPPLENSWHRNTSHHHHSFLVPVLIPTSERCCLDSFLLATLFLWSEWAIVHSKSFVNWITILTLVVQPNPYFGRTFQPMFICVCFPRAYFLISFDLANVISLFT